MEGPSHVDIGNYETLSRDKGRGRGGCGGRAVVLFLLAAVVIFAAVAVCFPTQPTP